MQPKLTIDQVTLPIASGSVLGGFKVGAGLAIDGTGILNVTGGGSGGSGGVSSVAGKVGDVALVPGDITGLATVASTGAYADLTGKPAAYTLPAATGSVIGGVKPGTGLSVDGAGVLTVTYTAPVTSVASRTGAIVLTAADVSGVAKYLGIFATTGALPAASSNTGSHALVGSSAPYSEYVSNGSAWVVVGSGGGGSGLTSGQISAGAVGVVGKYAPKTVSADKTFASTDDEQSFTLTAASLNMNLVAGMGWYEGVTIYLPTSGSTTFNSDGTVLLNGSSTTPIIRTSSSSQVVVTITVRGTDDLVISGF